MAGKGKQARRSGFSAMLMLGAAALIAVPGVGLALDAVGRVSIADAARGGIASFTPASVDPRMAELVSQQQTRRGSAMRFTPAGATERADRSVTVAVRVNGDSALAMATRAGLAARAEKLGSAPISITPTRFDLGVSREYKQFAQAEKPIVPQGLADIKTPNLASFRPSEGVGHKPSRFSAHLELEEHVNAGRAPRTAEGLGDQTVDLAGNFRVTRNLDLRAGVRYSQDRDRIAPVADVEKDSQAVYVGTQFRF